MARPRKHSPEKEAQLAEQIEKLGIIHCSWKEVAAFLDEKEDYLQKRFSESYEKGRNKGKLSLRRKMFSSAVDAGNITMMIWLSKQYLGMTDKQETLSKYDGKDKRLIIQLSEELDDRKKPD